MSTDANPTHTYAADGVYTVVLAATNSCGTTFVEQTVTIITVPVAAFTFNGAIGCSPFVVVFDNTSSDNATAIEWTFEGGTPATSTEENPVVTWDAPGVYSVTLVASNQAGSSTATASITDDDFEITFEDPPPTKLWSPVTTLPIPFVTVE